MAAGLSLVDGKEEQTRTGNWELGTQKPGHPRPQGASVQAECHGCRHGLPDGQPKREKVWVPTDAFLPCMDQVSQIVAPWIVAGQGKGEFPEAFNQIGMHTDVV